MNELYTSYEVWDVDINKEDFDVAVSLLKSAYEMREKKPFRIEVNAIGFGKFLANELKDAGLPVVEYVTSQRGKTFFSFTQLIKGGIE